MAFISHKDLYDPKNVPQFQEEVCKKTCMLKGKCIEEGQNTHWFLMCPAYHRWKIGYTSFVFEQLQCEREHPEEAKAKYQAKVEAAKKWKEEQKAKAKAEREEAKAKEKAEKIANDETEEKPKKTRKTKK